MSQALHPLCPIAAAAQRSQAFNESAKSCRSPIRSEEYVHFTGAYQSIKDATKLKLQAELLRTDSSLNEDDQEVMLEGRNIMVEYDRMSMGRRSGIPEHAWTFGANLQYIVEEWSQDLEDVDHPYRRLVKNYELIVDKSADESVGGLITPCGVFKDSIKHITLSDDHKQGQGITLSKDSNVGHVAMSRNLFQKITEDSRHQHNVFLPDEDDRMLAE
ncbi:hypothetical protein N0V83_010697 [Neocucurbitaria cava]|uniref:Uncharacterized protein n=1 Tax=Neocucurbitaria cava TaxID=798079 RepID=A0A9W8XWP5_9PLEO|nr:hypothetical protein N0V83_010697 [Neocucurbitaria cava]